MSLVDPDVVGPLADVPRQPSWCPAGGTKRIQRPTTQRSAGTRPRTRAPRFVGHPHFVQPPSSCESAITKPAAASVGHPEPVVARRRARRRCRDGSTTSRPTQNRNPATAATRAASPARVTPSILAPYPESRALIEIQAARVEARGVELGHERLHRPAGVVRKDVLDHPHVPVVVERHVQVRLRDEVHGEPRARPRSGRPPRSPRSPGASSVKNDGNAGRGRSSG